MKLLSLNFLTCAVRTCKPSPDSFPLHPRDAELESVALDFSPEFLRGVIPRLEWNAMRVVCDELGLRLRMPKRLAGGPLVLPDMEAAPAQEMEGVEETGQPAAAATAEREMAREQERGQGEGEGEGEIDVLADDTDEELMELHRTLIETQIVSGKLVCGNCGHEYAVKEGIANFLLPAHLV